MDWLEDGYQSALAHGVLLGAQAAGATMVCFAGGAPGAHERSAVQRNHIYELASPDTVDAIVVLSGSIANHVGLDGVVRFMERYRALPACSVALELPSLSSVVIENESGMRTVLEHLIRAHEHRRVAFVRGPRVNAEAERRFETYQRVLAENELEFDPALVTVGTFETESGRAAVRQLLDERKLRIESLDAIVASNDSMAFGVLEELASRKIRVPGDVAVAGFDDVEDARYSEPPLTTVRQPLDEQGREAVRILMGLLQGRPTLQRTVLRTELVVRESCGCSKAAWARKAAPAPSAFGFEASLVARRQTLLSALARASRGALAPAGPDWEVRTINAIASELRGESPGAFLKHVSDVADSLVRRGVELKPCHEVLAVLREEILACLGKEPERRALAEELLQEGRLAISAATERVLGRSRLKLERWARTLSKVGAALIGTFELSELSAAVSARLPELGIQSCFVVRYEPRGATRVPTSRLVLAYDGLVGVPKLSPTPFPTASILPPELLVDTPHPRNFVVVPLFFNQQVLGFAMIEFDIAQVFAYEALRDLLSAALKGAELVDQLRAAERARDEAQARLGGAPKA